MQSYAMELQGLTHRYGKSLALDNVNLKLAEGKIYGLLGRNGAGKSTLINILIAGMRPTSGKALVFGETTYEHLSALSKLCVVREKGMFPPYIKIKQVLQSCADLYPNWDRDYADKLLKLFMLNPKKRYRQLSRGMESSIGLIIGLASRAPLTVFDEPSLGLDAVARENFYSELVRDVDLHPRTVVISTHLIDEVSRMFEDVVIIDKGKVLMNVPISELLNAAVTVSGEEQAVRAAIGARPIMHEERLSNMYAASVKCEPGETFEGVSVEPLSLQRLFVYLTEGGEAK